MSKTIEVGTVADGKGAELEGGMECADCGCGIDDSSAMGAETSKGKWEDVCERCYYDLTNECQLCGERVGESDTSEFILCKAELSTTSRRPPGIYRVTSLPFLSIPMIGRGSMNGNSLRFVDKLPEFDDHYEISGHICCTCAKPFAKKFKKAYGKGPFTDSYDPKQWKIEREHTRKVILANQDMLRDLECDSVDVGPDGRHLDYASANDWFELKKLYDLPDLPTYHEMLFVEHQGVKVYQTCDGRLVSWLSLRPEPRFRNGAGRIFPETFSPQGLPTHRPTDSSRSYYHSESDAREAVIAAIEQGLLRRDGCFDANGSPVIYG